MKKIFKKVIRKKNEVLPVSNDHNESGPITVIEDFQIPPNESDSNHPLDQEINEDKQEILIVSSIYTLSEWDLISVRDYMGIFKNGDNDFSKKSFRKALKESGIVGRIRNSFFKKNPDWFDEKKRIAEILRIILKMKEKRNVEKDIDDSFNSMDYNENGFIFIEDFVSFMKKFGLSINNEEYETIQKFCIKDENDKLVISKKDYRNLLISL